MEIRNPIANCAEIHSVRGCCKPLWTFSCSPLCLAWWLVIKATLSWRTTTTRTFCHRGCFPLSRKLALTHSPQVVWSATRHQWGHEPQEHLGGGGAEAANHPRGHPQVLLFTLTVFFCHAILHFFRFNWKDSRLSVREGVLKDTEEYLVLVKNKDYEMIWLPDIFIDQAIDIRWTFTHILNSFFPFSITGTPAT